MSTNPNSALAMLNYGILLREKDKDFEKSLTVLRRGLQAHPDLSSFRNEIAGTCFAMGNYEAMYAEAQAMAKYPDRQYEAMLYSGIYYNAKKLTDSALGAYSRAIELRPWSYAALLNRARVYKQLKNWNAMETDLTEAIRLNPESADAYAERGNLYGNRGSLDKSLSDYNQYLRLRPDDAGGFYNRAQALFLMGRKAEGCNDLRRAVEMGLPEAQAQYRQRCQ
jgi:tetratricopeptide (TPR) repeat protein